MNSKANLKILLAIVTILAITSAGFKIKPIVKSYNSFNPESVYEINYSFFFKSKENNTTIRAYVPKNSSRQRISEQSGMNDSTVSFRKIKEENNNIRAVWNTKSKNTYHTIDYKFLFKGKQRKYSIPEYFNTPPDTYERFLKSSQHIQSEAPKITALGSELIQNAQNDRAIIKNVFDYVTAIPTAPIITLTDALTVIAQNRASCNGKSRLFVALARNLGYAARIRGGIILENTDKRTSHVWAEVWINGKWIPFDTLNNHFGYLPANYLELYQGDKPLITHTSGIQFDYTYQINTVNHVPFLEMTSDELNNLPGFSLWSLVDKGVIPSGSLHLLLLLPIGGLLVAFLRNIVGLKTFGVFLPVLISFSLLHTGFISGIAIFIGLILCIGLISYPFDKLGLLYTPKLVISLTIMVSVIILATHFGIKNNILWLTKLTFFPIIILTIAAERFSRATLEDGYLKALDKLFQTLLATAIVYVVLSCSWLPSMLILMPEIAVLIIVLAAVLGRYIGIRWIEIFRFKPLLVSEKIKN